MSDTAPEVFAFLNVEDEITIFDDWSDYEDGQKVRGYHKLKGVNDLPVVYKGIAQPKRGKATPLPLPQVTSHAAISDTEFIGTDQEIRITLAHNGSGDEERLGIGGFVMMRVGKDKWIGVANHIIAGVSDKHAQMAWNGKKALVTAMDVNPQAGDTWIFRAIGHYYEIAVIRAGQTEEEYIAGETDVKEYADLEARKWGFSLNKYNYSLIGYQFGWCVDAVLAQKPEEFAYARALKTADAE